MLKCLVLRLILSLLLVVVAQQVSICKFAHEKRLANWPLRRAHHCERPLRRLHEPSVTRAGALASTRPGAT